jgi:hypothetical protein
MPPKGMNWRRWLHGLGSFMAVFGVGFVVLRFHEYWGQLDSALWNPALILKVLGLSIVYGAGNLLLAMAWSRILLHLGAAAEYRCNTRIYGVSQLARYLPGNIFHLAGRQALGMAAGMPAGVLAKSTLWELGLISFAGALFSVLVLPVFWPAANAAVALLLWIATVAAATLGIWKFLGRQVRAAFLLQTLFLTLSAGVFVLLLAALEEKIANPAMLWPIAGGAYIVGWLIGLVTPGAPAGVGIREMVLLFLLGPAIPESVLLPAVVLSRLVTVAGDVVFFLGVVFLFGGSASKGAVKTD